MGYYLRLFTTKDDRIPLKEISSALPEDCRVHVELDSDQGWQGLVIKTKSGDEICLLERTPDDLAAEEISEFREFLEDTKPASAAKWVLDYLAKVKVIYACQVLELGFGDDYRNIPSEIVWALKQALNDGIMQADGEGFSNEDGYHVTWDFAPDVAGPWNMAVLTEAQNWTRFEMDLGSAEHREAFLDGRVPNGAKLV